MKGLVAVVVLIGLAGLAAGGCASPDGETGNGAGDGPPAGADGDAILAKAFEAHAGDLEVEGAGTVTRILADDNEGGRHQRFIVRLASGQTLLIAHNIDVAPRVEDLREGDTISFRGVYEWNEEGGTVHWTHQDPGGTHPSGWIRHAGHTYQ
jgi:ABC-type glycerol-3-phosphate transport system substrate-binding protein